MASPHSISLLFFLCFHLLFFISRSQVPSEETFTYVNEGEFGDYIVEYDGNYRALPPFRNPFQLCFYNTTPNSFTLAIRMGTVRSESLMRWVWEANRANPVRENATLTFGPDGNLVLAEADSRVAWQTGTANKGVVGFELLPNGNMVLVDSKGNFVWQSFDSPTDTLLVGQSLRANGVNRLVSRASIQSNVNGPYSFVMEDRRLVMYYKSNNSPRPVPYWTSGGETFYLSVDGAPLSILTLYSEPDSDFVNQDIIYNLYLGYENNTRSSRAVFSKYNNTLTYLRLGIDGNLRFFVYSPNVQGISWDALYAFHDRLRAIGECGLPERCGKFGLCEDNQCVSCPTPNGLVGWSQNCEAKKVVSCKASDFGYYKLEGVDHYMIKHTSGDQTSQSACQSKCTSDCKCVGYFYHTDQSRCWIAYDLMTMTRVGNSTNLAFIKTPNK